MDGIRAYALAHGVAGRAELFAPCRLPMFALDVDDASDLSNELVSPFEAPSKRLLAQRDACAASLPVSKPQQSVVAARVKSVLARPAADLTTEELCFSAAQEMLTTMSDWDADPARSVYLGDQLLLSRSAQTALADVVPLRAPSRLSEIIRPQILTVDDAAVIAFEESMPSIDTLIGIDLPPMTAECKQRLATEVLVHRKARQAAVLPAAAETSDLFDLDIDPPPLVHRSLRPATPPLVPRIRPDRLVQPLKLEDIAIDEPTGLQLPPNETLREWEGMPELRYPSSGPSSTPPLRRSSPPSDISLPPTDVKLAPLMSRANLGIVKLIDPPAIQRMSSPASLPGFSGLCRPDDPRMEDAHVPALLHSGQIGRPSLPPVRSRDLASPLLPASVADLQLPKLVGCKDLAMLLSWSPLQPIDSVPVETLVDAVAPVFDMPVEVALASHLALSMDDDDDALALDDDPPTCTPADPIEPFVGRQWSSSAKENIAPTPVVREVFSNSSGPTSFLAPPPPPPHPTRSSIESGSTSSFAVEPGLSIFYDATPLSRASSRTSEPVAALQEIHLPPPRSVRSQLDAFVAMRVRGQAPAPTPPQPPPPPPPARPREPTPALSLPSAERVPTYPAREPIRVLASVELLQLPVFRHLGPAGFDLVEAPDIADHIEPHLVLDGLSALCFVQMQYLPRQLDALVARFAHLQPSAFDQLALVVFGSSLNPHLATNPAVVKALAQLREAGIEHHVVGSAHEAAETAYAFAAHARLLAAASTNATWTPWSDPERRWLGEDIDEDVVALLDVAGMHLFAAQAMLSRTTLAELCDLDPAGRHATFDGIVGAHRIDRLNLVMAANAARIEAADAMVTD